MTMLFQDVRHAIRALTRGARGFTLVAIATLALGVGANTAIFSLIDAVLLRPLPFRDPDALVNVYERRSGLTGPVSGHEFAAWRDRNQVFESIGTSLYATFNRTGDGEPETVRALQVSSNYFDVLGVRPEYGRVFRDGEDRPGANRVVVLSGGFWKRRFGADPAIVGRTITFDNQAYEVVGVTSARGDLDPDVWTPINLPLEIQRVGRHSMNVVARLKPGVTLERASADVEAIAHAVEREYPDFNTGHGVQMVALHDALVGKVRRPIFIAFGAVAFVLLIACANVAHLLLTRASSRHRDLAVRAALGASRGQLIRHVLVESLLISLCGGGAGVLLAAWIVDLLPAITVVSIPRLNEMTINGRVLAATFALSMLTGLVSGAVPALRSSRPLLNQRRHDGARISASGRFTGLLVVSEIALALVLLIGAGLMIQSFMRLVRVEPGFNPQNVLTMAVALPNARYAQPQQRLAAFDDLTRRIAAVPGVVSAAGTSLLPLLPGDNRIAFTIEGRPPVRRGEELRASVRTVTADYFRTMHIPIRRGRSFAATDARVALPLIRWFEQQPMPAGFDRPQAAPVALINEAAARAFWPGEDPIGRRLRLLFSPPIEIVGIAGDVRHAALSAMPGPEIYLTHAQEPQGALTLVVRTAGDPSRAAASVRDQVRALDRDLPVSQMRTMEEVLSDSVGRPRFDALLLGTFAAVALLLSVIGIYGVTSYSVGQRTKEIGIRSALGARPRDVLRLVLGRTGRLTLAGIVVGLGGAVGLTRVLATQLYDVRPTDAATYLIVSLALAAVSMLASYIPAVRALRVDPLTALRAE